MAIRSFLENYRANAGYEFYENYGLEFSYSQPLVKIGNFHLSIAIKINRMMKIILFLVQDMIKWKVFDLIC